jgi:Uncharacterised protein family (UPF0236)
MSKAHPFSEPVLGQRTSPFLQEKLADLGCDEVFGALPDRISSLLGIEVNQSQVYRTCQNVAEQLDERELNTPCPLLSEVQNKQDEQVYAMVDGSMIFTDAGWQETKVGRIFQAEHHIENEEHRWKMGASHYIARRGHYTSFTAHFEQNLPPDSACKKIFVTDGATWIGQWIAQRYAGSVHIIDFFHVCEKLASVAPKGVSGWLAKQKEALLNSEVEAVIAEVKTLQGNEEAINQLFGYLENHKHQMDYGYYRQQGWMIGSGAIESAHRTLLQVRMKRSGQRWANDGADSMIKLRIAYTNGRRDLVQSVLKKAA